MILGRATALWAGLVGAVLNVVGMGLVIVTGSELSTATVALFAGLDALALSILGILANVAVTGSAFGRGPKA